MEDLQTNQSPNPDAAKWDNMDVPNEAPETQRKAEILPIGTEVINGAYQISSLPFDSKDVAYDAIGSYWGGADTTTYYHDGKWYIISK